MSVPAPAPAAATSTTPAAKPPLTKEQKDALNRLRAKADMIEAFFTHKTTGPQLKDRLPEVNYDIKHLYSLSEAELDDIQILIDRAGRSIMGCTLFTDAFPILAPQIENVLVRVPYFKENGWDLHGISKALMKNKKMPYVLAHADIIFNQTIGAGPIGGIASTLIEAFRDAHARNMQRRITINFYHQTGKRGITREMQKRWGPECEAHGIKDVHNLIAYLEAEENGYALHDQEDERRAREATGDYSASDGAEDAPDMSAVPSIRTQIRTGRSEVRDEEHKTPPSADSDLDED